MRLAMTVTILATVALGLAACEQRDSDDPRGFRDAQEQVEDAAEAAGALSEAIDACKEEFSACKDAGTDLLECADGFQVCLGELPEVELPEIPEPEIPEPEIPDVPEPEIPDFPEPEIPDFPELPEIPDGFGGACVDALWDCIGAGGDPQTCADEANACFEAEVSTVCDDAAQACVDAGAPADLCQQISDNC